MTATLNEVVSINSTTVMQTYWTTPSKDIKATYMSKASGQKSESFIRNIVFSETGRYGVSP